MADIIPFRVWDTFMLWDELDLLECRLTEFEDLPYPVTHVISEARVTHRGDPKPLHFLENAHRFARWASRIEYVLAEPLAGRVPWDRERSQREFCRAGLRNALPLDVVLHGDLDEIPRMSAVERAVKECQDGRPRSLVMRQFLYAVDWYHPDLDQKLTVAVRSGDLNCSLVQLRANMGIFEPVPDGGWHLSWLGGEEGSLRKLQVHCHLEMTDEERYWPESGRAYREGRTHGGVWQVPVDDLSDYPRYIRERRCPDNWFRPKEDS